MTQCNDIKAMVIANLVETTWLYRYSRLSEIMHDRGSEFLGNKFINTLIQNGYIIWGYFKYINKISGITVYPVNTTFGKGRS